METVTVTIGRNVGSEPMPAPRWRVFVRQTRDVVDQYVTDGPWTDVAYSGSWEGVSEDAHLWYGPLADGADRDELAINLASLAERYGQDGIGLAFGRSVLVGPGYRPDPLAAHLAATAS